MAAGTSGGRSKMIGVVAVVVIVAGLGWIGKSFFGGSGGTNGRAYFTADDGTTLFADDFNRVAPFDHGGQPAVRAHVFSCDGKKTQFVAYLEKLGLAEGKGAEVPGNGSGPLVKKPGEGRWLSPADGRGYVDVITVQPPAGAGATIEEVFP